MPGRAQWLSLKYEGCNKAVPQLSSSSHTAGELKRLTCVCDIHSSQPGRSVTAAGILRQQQPSILECYVRQPVPKAVNVGHLQVSVGPARPGLHVHTEHGALPGEAVVVESHWQPARGGDVAEQDVCYGSGTLQRCSWLSAPNRQVGAHPMSLPTQCLPLQTSQQEIRAQGSQPASPLMQSHGRLLDTVSAHACTFRIGRRTAARAQGKPYSRVSSTMPRLAGRPSCRDSQALGRRGSASGKPARCLASTSCSSGTTAACQCSPALETKR